MWVFLKCRRRPSGRLCGENSAYVAPVVKPVPRRSVAAGVVVVSDISIVPSVNGGRKVGHVGGLIVGLR